MMKRYTNEEKMAAKIRLPQPISDFISSKELAESYAEIAKKHSLNLRQTGVVVDLTEAALLGLESEEWLPAYLREELAELPNEKRQGLVDAINNMIFKRARQLLAGDTPRENPAE